MSHIGHIVIHTDGGARGNPGRAAVGVVIERVGNEGTHRVAAFGKCIGQATNNIAEYTAVIEALQHLVDKHIETGGSIQFYLDSTLVANQLSGLYKVKEPHLRELLTRARVLEGAVGGNIRYTAIPREQNTKADALVNQALDA